MTKRNTESLIERSNREMDRMREALRTLKELNKNQAEMLTRQAEIIKKLTGGLGANQ